MRCASEEGLMKPRMPISRLSEDAMRELVVGIVSGKVITSAQVPDVSCPHVFLPAAMGAFSPPEELREALLGSSQPPENLEGEPEKPTHPGYGEEPPMPPKPPREEVSLEVRSGVEWGDVDDEELDVEVRKVEKRNAKAAAKWARDMKTWKEAIKAHKSHCDAIDLAYAEEVQSWRSTLDAHEEKVAERERLRKEWIARHDDLFSDWMGDLGVLWGHVKDAFPRSINGFPVFYEVGAIHKEDWNRIQAAVEREVERAKTLEV